jgi:hypothetical protein
MAATNASAVGARFGDTNQQKATLHKEFAGWHVVVAAEHAATVDI